MRRELQSSTATIGKITSIVPIVKGGTSAGDASSAIVALGGIPANKLGVANGVLGLDGSGKISNSVIPSGGSGNVTVNGNKILAVSAVGTYTITNYDSFKSYTVVAISGTVSRVGDTITYTAPAGVGSGGFSINGEAYSVTVVTTQPAQAVISSPVNGATGVIESPTITTSTFSMLAGSDTHASTDWQIAIDAGFTNIVAQSINDVVNKTSWSGILPTSNITYYIRARHKGTSTGYGTYSSTVSFTAKASFFPTTEEAKLTASDRLSNDYFGYSVAISGDGTYIVVGAWLKDVSNKSNAGAAYVFIRSNNSWTQQAKLIASDAADSDMLGTSVSISGDGTYVIVGAAGVDIGVNTGTGAAYIFSRSGATWTQQAKLIASDAADSDMLGTSVSITTDGVYAAIGAGGFNNHKGAAYVFMRTGVTWTQQAKLIASDAAAGWYFGEDSIAISVDGTYIIVGVRGSSSTTNVQGCAYIFSRSGTTWTQQAKIEGLGVATDGQFGKSVSISNTGTYAIVGAWEDDISTKDRQGSAYVFIRSGTTWSQQAKLTASDGTALANFGSSVSMSSDATKVIIGAVSDGLYKGAAYIFSRSGTTWTQQAKLTASDKVSGDAAGAVGNSVAISSDGSRVVLGGPYSDADYPGAAYVFS